MDRNELLLHPLAFMPPPRLLAGLEPAESARVVPGATHSIVEILAHLVFWQSWFLGRCAGDAKPMVARASEGWPVAGAEHWLILRAQFLADLQQAAEWRGEGPVVPAIEAPPMAHYTISDALTHLAVHNAHHLGQVVTMRQVLGAWPPPEGSWTW